MDAYARVCVTLIIKRRIITACTRTEHRVYGTYLLHNNVPPVDERTAACTRRVCANACATAAWAARSST